MNRIRVALVGYGLGGKVFHAPLIASIPEFELTAIVSSRREQIAADFPGRVMGDRTEGADLVVISTPDATHYPLAAAALEAGQHVVVDKPFTLNLDEAKRLARLAEEQGRLLSVYQNRRWDSDFLGLQEIVASGRLGQITQFESRIDRYRPEVRQGTWREGNPDAPAFWFDLGAHLADQAIELFGVPEAVSLFTATVRPTASVEDWFHAILHYPKVCVSLHASALVPGDTPRFAVHGIEGSWIKYGADVQEDQAKAGMLRSDAAFGVDPRPGFFTPSSTRVAEPIPVPTGDHAGYYRAVRDALVHGAANPVPPSRAVTNMAVLEAGARSLVTGRPEIPEN
ncbi:oxidoreductase [Bryobacter aggregatus]|uniref:oxidoreductase n=1 Tax=Bryobacter aggregatus TaxID=360054 RepID=UPI0004E28D83|nr:oxidoreductase [Bryobacter aggregatus]